MSSRARWAVIYLLLLPAYSFLLGLLALLGALRRLGGRLAFILELVVVRQPGAPRHAMGVDPGEDQTPQDYHADLGDVGVDDELSSGTHVHA